MDVLKRKNELTSYNALLVILFTVDNLLVVYRLEQTVV